MATQVMRRTIERPNRRQWQVGDLVIHDRDAKEHRMLRVVVAELPGGALRTVFAFRNELPESWRRKVYECSQRELHDPKRFGISLSERRAA